MMWNEGRQLFLHTDDAGFGIYFTLTLQLHMRFLYFLFYVLRAPVDQCPTSTNTAMSTLGLVLIRSILPDFGRQCIEAHKRCTAERGDTGGFFPRLGLTTSSLRGALVPRRLKRDELECALAYRMIRVAAVIYRFRTDDALVHHSQAIIFPSPRYPYLLQYKI